MSSGIFFLDEERDREISSTSPPVPSPTISTDSAQNSPSVSASVPSTSLPPPSLLAPPQINHGGLLAPQPQPLISPLGRKHTNSFAATPSFPSPLAQAVTVPLNSDDSSSDSHSEEENEKDARARRGSPSSGSGTPKRTDDRPGSRHSRNDTRSASPASTQKSISRPSSPLRGNAPTTILTPGALLMNKHSSPGMNIAGSLPNMTNVPLRESPPRQNAKEPSQLGPRRSEARAREVSASGSAKGHLRARSGSSSSSMGLSSVITETSPRAQGSPDLFPEDMPVAQHRRRESISGSPSNSLGFWGSSWETSSTGSSGTGVSRDKGKGKEGPPPSPRRERDIGRTPSMSMTSYVLRFSLELVADSSPPRQRRPSEFLSSAFDGRKMPLTGGNRNSAVASLSTSASMVSPLNPLPSPWASGSESSAFGAPSSHLSDVSSMTTPSSSAGAIRLNRVPTSVKLATELMKNSPSNPLSPPLPITNTPSSATGNSSAIQVTPNPSPAGSLPNTSTVQPGRDLGQTSSLPVGALRPSSFESGKGKLAVPPAPAPTRATSSVDKTPTLGLNTGIPSLLSPPLMPPPSAFKVPSLPPQAARSRPSAPADASGSGNTLQEPFQSVRHRYRTSMHEPYRPIVIPEVSASPPSWGGSPTLAAGSTSAAAATPEAFKIPDRAGAYGLGFNMPSSAAAYLTPEGGSGSVTPGGLAPGKPKFRSATGQALQMDLAGVGGMGDAASHATMIMQSRQAKLQRWRPNSAGNVNLREGGAIPVPPPFNRSTTSGVPAMLAGPRTDRATAWGLIGKHTASSASSPGEDLPPIPNTMSAIGVVPEDNEVHEITRDFGGLQMTPGNPIGRGLPSTIGGMGMERQASASGTVGGIEWVDWYDCYKRYKDAKIRAEAAEAARSAAASTQPSPKESSHLSPNSGSSTKGTPGTDAGGTSKVSPNPEASEAYVGSFDAQSTSAIALTPSTSRDELSHIANQGARRRSASIRSNMSDIRMSPSQKMASIFERPRQSSGSSARSTDSLGTANLKKKKNLVIKMEGWWNAVKSNFIPESQYTPRQPSNLGPSPRVPSAPSSRRGSEIAPLAAASEGQALAPPPNIRRDSGLRPAASHAELRSRPDMADLSDIPSSASASADLIASGPVLAHGPRSVSEGMLPPPVPSLIHRAPSTVTEEASAPSRSSLESRRRQPSLRLELEPHILTRGSSRTASSGGSNPAGRFPHRPSHTDSRSSSYGQPSYGPGLTPGVPKWDQTPSPIVAVNYSADAARENKPVAPGADITIASVRRHVKHRIDAAKIACDAKLKETIDQMTHFAEERREEEMRMTDRETGMTEDAMRDYFEGISDSPLVDAEESEVEQLETLSDVSRSRNVSSSRGPSRRASISRPVGSFGASPSRRASMLPSSPNRLRRRPSAAPRSFAPRDRLSRNFSLSLEKPMSTSSSRSTSRSRSPMPTSRSMLGALDLPSDSEKQFLATLQELIVLATDMLETSVNYLVAHPSFCAEMVQKLQMVGSQWDEHDDWDGRRWYVQILMAVANLSTILDWWKEEKRFWNFDDEAENEPILFVMRPPKDALPDAGGDYFRGVPTHTSISAERSPVPGMASLPGSEPLSAISQGVSSPDSAVGAATARMSLGSTLPVPSIPPAPPTPKAQGVEDLRVLAEHAKSVNIVMELGLAGEEIQYVNDAIGEVTGRDPDEVLFKPISDILAPADASTFIEATQRLLEDDNNTVQLRVRFEVQPPQDEDDRDRPPGPVYIELEGVGMLMREQNQPSHTMWVLKPVPAIVDHTLMDVTIPLDSQHFSNDGILCRICEREIVTWFFEKHNETCDAVHRLEAEISESNDCLQDLYHTVMKLNAEIEDSVAPAQYQGVLFFTLPESVTSAEHSPPGPQGVELRKMTRGHLAEIIDILALAKSIETPSVRDDEADLPFNVQCYLDEASEENLATITRWQRPQTTDRALTLLFTHVEIQLRRKQKAIARMQSTIRYSEKTRHEWEDKVNQMLADREGDAASESGSAGAGDADAGSDSGGETSPIANTTVETVHNLTRETSPPTSHRKIAPKARLPITSGHPRPATAPHEGEAPPAFGHGSARLAAVSQTPLALSVPPTPAPPTPATIPMPPQGISPHTVPEDTVPSPADIGLPISASAPALTPLTTDLPALHDSGPSPLSIAPVPVALAPPGAPAPAPAPAAEPDAATLGSTPVQIPQRSKSSDVSQLPSLSPLIPPEKFGHLRRRSFMPGGKDLGPLSPRIPSAALPSRAQPPSIKDFEIIKPISRGAFGSVYLAKKVATGDYYAIKALKKSDMIAKNQITNVKAERTILMNQASSPYVVKLFFSFQSKDYLYLVMEYLNGGDCATLVKTLGGLPEEWARNYIAEVVLGLEYLHARNIVHRDIKPDNLLIDSRGHLKLTDFGLSRIGLLNRQVGGPRPAYLRGTSLRGSTRSHRPPNPRTSSASSNESNTLLSPELQPPLPISTNLSQSYFGAGASGSYENGSADESSGSESADIIPKMLRNLSTATKLSSDPNTPSVSGKEPPRFVGTPDYLAPESILGIGTDDRAVDWWALGVVLYEFIYGIPPFHADTPEKVFDNVISRRIQWHEDDIDVSPAAHDLMDRLMCSKAAGRLGARGAEEVKAHPFFEGVDWDTITTAQASFVPEVTDPESTDYFDARGAVHAFHDEEAVPQVLKAAIPTPGSVTSDKRRQMEDVIADISAQSQDDFGTFNFKNLPVLKQANDDVIRKMRTESMPASQYPSLEGALSMKDRPRSLSVKVRHKPKRKTSDLSPHGGPPSPATSTSSAASTPSRGSVPPSTPGTGPIPPIPMLPQHFRRPSELNALDRVKLSDDGEHFRRVSAPTHHRMRAGSGSSGGGSERSASMELWRQRRQASLNVPEGMGSALGLQPGPMSSGTMPMSIPLDSPDDGVGKQLGALNDGHDDRALDVLIAEDNPISQKILETLLTRMGCRCICVEDGPQALAATMGHIRFDVIIVDIHMPVVNGEQVARMIRSTNNHNQNTPIIAATSYEQGQALTEEGTLFSAILAKPVSKTALMTCLAKLGFVMSAGHAVGPSSVTSGGSTAGSYAGSLPGEGLASAPLHSPT